MTICPILAVGINDVNAGCGQLGESFNHLSIVCAGSGQMGEQNINEMFYLLTLWLAAVLPT